MDFIMSEPKGSVWVAHNGGRFDNIFLMRELLVQRKIVPKVIMNGSRIMCMELEERNLKIIDSYLFLSMRLSAFPKALGIKDLTKGFHPYLFTDLNYIGPMIGLEYFDPPAEGSKEREVFDRWYEQQISKTYIFREAIYYYCRLDVDILRQGCIIFACLIYKETKILDHFVDRYCDDTRTIYQFHGCFYHGCKKCYDGEDYNQIVHERFFILRARTQRMIALFRQHGYEVVEKWECDYRKESHISADQIKRISLGEFFEHLNLNPRDALFGGRTSPAILYYDREGDLKKRKVRYYDVTSLYPFVQKMFDFPTQHPVIFRGEVCNSKNPKHIFGLIKCKILPPTNLLLPVLPYQSVLSAMS
jgi:hypothetical protein